MSDRAAIVYAGIDEAGYGPMLGPLCVAASAFAIDGHDPGDGAPDLWERLESAVCRGARDAQRRIAVDDSKRLKGANDARAHPLRHLERGVLSFAGGPERLPDDDALLSLLGSAAPDRDWYATPIELPVAHDAGSLRIDAARLRRALEAEGVRMLALRCRVVDAGALNDGLDRAGTKAAVSFEAVARLAEEVRRLRPDAHPRIVIDRQGGRTHYLGELRTAWPEASIRIVAESSEVSRYRLELPEGPITLTFTPGAESRHLPVALASMTAKYVRELMMTRLNRYFGSRLPSLRPTAGYVADGRRWLRDAEPLLRDLAVPREHLVRNA